MVIYLTVLKNSKSYITSTFQVQEIIIYEQYEPRSLNNDIALLKLKSEVVFTNFVQPACLWNSNVYKKLPYPDILGTVSCNDLLSECT